MDPERVRAAFFYCTGNGAETEQVLTGSGAVIRRTRHVSADIKIITAHVQVHGYLRPSLSF